MDIPWSPVQRRRLQELGTGADLDCRFASEAQRDAAFQELEKRLVKARRADLAALQKEARPPALCRLERKLSDLLAESGFTRVLTPSLPVVRVRYELEQMAGARLETLLEPIVAAARPAASAS